VTFMIGVRKIIGGLVMAGFVLIANGCHEGHNSDRRGYGDGYGNWNGNRDGGGYGDWNRNRNWNGDRDGDWNRND